MQCETAPLSTQASYAAFALAMLKLVQRGRDKDIIGDSFFTFFWGLLPMEMSDKLLMINFGVLFALYKSKRSMFSGWLGSIAGTAQLIAIGQLYSIYKSNLDSKYAIRERLAASSIPKENVARIGDLSLRRCIGSLLPLPANTGITITCPGVKKVDTVVYARVGKTRARRMKMDVYKHSSTTKNAPMFFYIHGGGWVSNDREHPPIHMIYQIASQGYIVAVCDYRKSPANRFPTHIIDCKHALAYLRQNAGRFGGDKDFIAVGGDSAGGHLASLVALTANEPVFQPGLEDVDTSVQACVESYAVHDFLDRHGIYYKKDRSMATLRFIHALVMQKDPEEDPKAYEVASPMCWVEKDPSELNRTFPPFFVGHGRSDTLVPYKDSLLFYEKLQQHRLKQQDSPVVEDVYVEVPDSHHAFNGFVTPRALAYGDAAVAFLDNVYAKTQGKKHKQDNALVHARL